MQKLQAKLKNTPGDASQVPCSGTSLLNRDQTSYPIIDAQCIEDVLACNDPDVNQSQNTGSLKDVFVFVISIDGKPLMPCKAAKCKRLLKSGRAKVLTRFPFTIQLNFECENVTQEVNLGIDTGFGNIGFSATTEKNELICGTLILDGRTKERLEEKSMYRRGRRNRHHWYREPRFDNRSKPEGWLPLSVNRRYQTHLTLINKLKKILPVSNVILEIANFDIQKIETQDIEGVQYQQGNLYQYQNVRSYLMSREKGKCQLCGQGFKSQPSHVHHIVPVSQSGNNRVGNLSILHKKCHEKLHKKHLEKQLKANSKGYKQSTFMSIIQKRFWKDIPDLKVTFGNVTFIDRNKINLPKTHYNDAFVISGASNQTRTNPLEIKQVHRNNRVLQVNRKGFKPSIKREKSKINPGDIFWVNKMRYVCKGMFSYGKQILFGTMKKKEYLSFAKVTKVFRFGSFVWNI